MKRGARTPEELESLLEDAFVTRDAEALCAMFEERAVLVAGTTRREARGRQEIGRLAKELWEGDRIYVAEPQRVVQARRTALVVGSGAISVLSRDGDGDGDGDWRYAIALLSEHQATTKEKQ